MCDFASWLEHKKTGEIKFLTADDIFKSRRGKELQRYNPVKDDWVGHGSILWFFSLDRKDWLQKECTDFSTPDNFPKKIITAIKSGKMAINGVPFPEGLLRSAVEAKWHAEWDAVEAKWHAERSAVNAKWKPEWDAVEAKWHAERDAVEAKWHAERSAVDAKWHAERDAVDAKWNAEWDAVDAKWNAEWDAVEAKEWKLFELLENRNPLWR